jgi:uncharacterized OsmC-like protein
MIVNHIVLENLKATAEAVKTNPEARYTPFKVDLNWEEGTRNRVKVRNFPSMVIAEPEGLGGKNEGPNPVEYLLSGAVGCFSISFELIASQQGIKINSYHATIEGKLDFAVFFGYEEGERGVRDITLTVSVDAEGTEKQVREIINEACRSSVVLNTLKPKVKVVMA